MANGHVGPADIPRGLQMFFFMLAGACLAVLGAASLSFATCDSAVALALDPTIRISALAGGLAG